MDSEWESNSEIQRFRQYLRIETVQPNVNYGVYETKKKKMSKFFVVIPILLRVFIMRMRKNACIAFLKQQAQEVGLLFEIYAPYDETKPVAVLTWKGTDTSLPSILLNSHMDVVPVVEKSWKYPPFGAVIADGKIYARGTQDMKSVGMQYLSAVKALKDSGIRLKRTVHISFVPDEEIGGDNGMKLFVSTEEFHRLNVGFALDEGISSPDDTFPVFYGERSVWRIDFVCKGTTGHGSLLPSYTAGEKLRHIIDRLLDFRAEQVERLKNNPEYTIGDVTSVNLTIVKGGVQANVLPEQLSATFDIRLAVDVDHDEFEEMINTWCKEAGEGVTPMFIAKRDKVAPTVIDDSNLYWKIFRETIIDDLKLKIQPQIFPGRTDSCYIRQVGIPAIGFSPLNNTPVLLHDNDEFVAVDTYLKGIAIYKKLIENLANL